MLKVNNQLSFCLSSHASLYDILIEKNNFWRQLKDMVDFSFVYDELKDKYSSTMGRRAEDVIRMFKYLLLKNYYKLSDRDLIERTKTDMLFKYFLDYLPEETNLIDPSLLTVFRRERLSNKDNEEETSTNLMDKLIAKTVEIALSEVVIEAKNKIIQDSTHTNAMYQHISPREELIRQAKELRKSIYKIDETMHNKMPKKRESTGLLEDQIEYTKELLDLLKEDARFTTIPAIKEKMNMLEETMSDTEYEIEYSKDQDAKIGHKTADTSFFGYKAHIAMTPERIITAETVTSGEKHDGKELQKLVEKSQANAIEVEAVIGDGAYSERYKIEAKNAELKSRFGYDSANACGKNGITIQGASALFLANIKRIIKLKEEKTQNNG